MIEYEILTLDLYYLHFILSFYSTLLFGLLTAKV